MAVIPADLAVRLVEAGWVGEGWRDGMGVGGWGGVPRRGCQRPGVTVRDSEGWRAVVLIGDSGCSSPWSQGLSLRQLVSQLWHSFFFLREQMVTMTQQSSLGTSPLRLFGCAYVSIYLIVHRSCLETLEKWGFSKVPGSFQTDSLDLLKLQKAKAQKILEGLTSSADRHQLLLSKTLKNRLFFMQKEKRERKVYLRLILQTEKI